MKSFFVCIGLLFFTVTAYSQSKPFIADSLENLFRNTPAKSKPYVWWHWMGPNFSKEGITKDLEAMKAAGIGGATIFNLASAVQESQAPTMNNPWPWQTYRSPSYWEAIRYAAAEAQRLGLEIGLHNTAGYSTTGGPWIDEARGMKKLVWRDTIITGGSEISLRLAVPGLPVYAGWGTSGKQASLYHDIAVLAVPEREEVSQEEIVVLTDKMDGKGLLKWEAPAGRWKISRIGYAPTMANPHPLPDDLIGRSLEVDKMSAEQNTFHWETVIGPVKEYIGEYLGKSFCHMLIDSYEAGYQNWTPGFREEFIRRKGYDPVPWLASFGQPVTGDKENKGRRIINDDGQTKRFEWDYQDVISQLYFENGWKIGKKLLHEANLNLQFEPYWGPFSTSSGAALADLPMGEFWTGSNGKINSTVPAAARAAGRTVVGAEAFTGRPENSQWTEDPAFLKRSADGAFASGVNRLVLHHWVHQPFDDKYQPGMGMGWWGTHFSRFQTWFEQGKAFFAYLGRCQALLQYGEQVSDYLCIDRPDGFSDVISKDDFLDSNISVEKGKIILPSGRSYAFMVFPGEGEMLPEVAEKIRDMAGKGATIVAAKPSLSPSLKDFPQSGQAIKDIADEVWGDGPKNNYKQGFVFTKIEDAAIHAGIKPDYQVEEALSPDEIKIVHRHSDKADLYFVFNQSAKAQFVSVSFRISGKQPELWQAEDESAMNAPVWDERDGRTTVGLKLRGQQTVFVVFRKPASGSRHLASVSVADSTAGWDIRENKQGRAVLAASAPLTAKLQYASGKQKEIKIDVAKPIEISGEWHVLFKPKMGQPFSFIFPELKDFSLCENKDVKYFSGTAVYSKKIAISKTELKKDCRLLLSLGEMNDIAGVRVNGQNLGVLWYPPYEVDITDVLKPGENNLEIDVSNNWANRLIGDEQEPADFEWGQDRGKLGHAMKAYPDWFIKGQPRPSAGRQTFSIWYYYRNDSPLQPAGLAGPVKIVRQSVEEL